MENEKTKIYKKLKIQLSQLNKEKEILRDYTSVCQRRLQSKMDVIKEVQSKIDELKPREVQMSDHALVRYLERICDIDINYFKSLLIKEDLIDIIHKLGGNGKFPTEHGYVIVKDYIIVTIVI